MSTIGNVAVRDNDGAETGIRRRINLIDGANVTITTADDPVNHEIDVTIAAAGSFATAWVDGFWPAVDTDSYKGAYASVNMSDNVETTARQTFIIPDDITAITRAVVIIIPDASGNLYWSCATNFGQVCANEDYQTHTDSIALNASAVTADEIECIDITAGLTGVAGGDLVGIEFVRDATNALDTINDVVHYIGILIQGVL